MYKQSAKIENLTEFNETTSKEQPNIDSYTPFKSNKKIEIHWKYIEP